MYSRFKRHSDVLPSGFSFSNPKSDYKNPLNKENLEYQSLGSKIRQSQNGGDILGVQIVPEFDDMDCDDIDVRTVAKMDAFDECELGGSSSASEVEL